MSSLACLVQDSDREVSRDEGTAVARKHGCLFAETSAKANVAVDQAFEELVLKILETPSLVEETRAPGGLRARAHTEPPRSACC
jgi:Ras-related protein Rab-18